MKKLYLNWSKNSLRFKLTLTVFIMTFPLVGMLLYNNFYAIDVVREQVAESYSNTLTLHMNQIDSHLSDIDSYLNTLAGNGYDLIALKTAENDDQYYTSKTYIYNKIAQDSAMYDLLGAFFVYIEDRQEYMDVYSSNITYMEREKIQIDIEAMIYEQAIPKGIKTKRWQYIQVENDHYLLNIVESGNIYIGSWVRVDELLKPLQAINIGEEGIALITNEHGEAITNANYVREHSIDLKATTNNHYITGKEQKYLVVGTESYRANIQIATLIPERYILSNLPYLQQLIWIITVAALITIPIGIFFLREIFLVPIKKILNAMSKVRVGDWSVRVDLEKHNEEFKTLGHSFNAMMSEIQRLRVNVFEDQINKQREELQRLQLQVNPHFYLNSLNIVYNLAKVKNYNLIMEMSSALSNYFRFLFRNNTSFVKLRDELEHTRNYLYIQTLRFPEQLKWSINSPEYFNDVPVPPLIVQSFVENSVKYAVSMESLVYINVDIAFADTDEESNIKITITDTGDGFEESVLRELQAGRSIQNKRGERTGIWNVQRRLKLLYQDNVTIQYLNDKQTGGAVVEIILPTNPNMEELQ